MCWWLIDSKQVKLCAINIVANERITHLAFGALVPSAPSHLNGEPRWPKAALILPRSSARQYECAGLGSWALIKSRSHFFLSPLCMSPYSKHEYNKLIMYALSIEISNHVSAWLKYLKTASKQKKSWAILLVTTFQAYRDKIYVFYFILFLFDGSTQPGLPWPVHRIRARYTCTIIVVVYILAS